MVQVPLLTPYWKNVILLGCNCQFYMNISLFCCRHESVQNPVYRRHWISEHAQIVAPIPTNKITPTNLGQHFPWTIFFLCLTKILFWQTVFFYFILGQFNWLAIFCELFFCTKFFWPEIFWLKNIVKKKCGQKKCFAKQFFL